MFITWKCLWSQMKIYYSSWLAQWWFSLKITLVIGWISWACCWKCFQHIWQAFALCESNFLERHPRVLTVKKSSCSDTPAHSLHIFLLSSSSLLQSLFRKRFLLDPIVWLLVLTLTEDSLNLWSPTPLNYSSISCQPAHSLTAHFHSLTQFTTITMAHLALNSWLFFFRTEVGKSTLSFLASLNDRSW